MVCATRGKSGREGTGLDLCHVGEDELQTFDGWDLKWKHVMVCGLVLVGVGHVGDMDMQSMSLGVCRLWASEANTMLERIDTWIILVL